MMLRIKISKAIPQIQYIYKSIIDGMLPVFKELADILVETFNNAFESVKPSVEEVLNKFQELSEMADEFEVVKGKPTKPYNFYVPPRNAGKTWYYEQYQRKMIRDKRSDIRHFTIKK